MTFLYEIPTLQHEEGRPGQGGSDVGWPHHLQRPRDDAQSDGVYQVRVHHRVERGVAVLVPEEEEAFHRERYDGRRVVQLLRQAGDAVVDDEIRRSIQQEETTTTMARLVA